MSATLQEICARHQAQKMLFHSYGPVYEAALAPYRDSARWVMEIGIFEGNSLRAWREYFRRAVIVGFDIEPARAVYEDRIFSATGDQGRSADLCRLPSQLGVQFDVVIDDGSHLVEHQAMSLFSLWPYLAPGGIYVIEDVQDAAFLPHFLAFRGAEVLDLRPNLDRYDDLLVIVRKPV